MKVPLLSAPHTAVFVLVATSQLPVHYNFPAIKSMQKRNRQDSSFATPWSLEMEIFFYYTENRDPH